jgi:hypothetical protein
MKNLLAFLIAMIAFGASATTITLDTSSLPSTQGWEYRASGSHAGTVETDMFSVSGSVLTMNNMGEPLNWRGGSAAYRLLDVVDSSKDATLEWTSRTTEYEKTASGGHDAAFFVAFRDGQYRYVVKISKDRIVLDNESRSHTLVFDATQYHTYRIETWAGTKTYNFYIDDVLHATLSGRPDSSPNMLYFGDGTSTANARCDIATLKFSQVSFDIGLSDSLNADGCVEATAPEGATVHLFADDTAKSPSKTYSWSTSSGDAGSGETFECTVGVDQQVIVSLTVEDTATGGSDTVTKTVCVSDTTAPKIIILSPQNGDAFCGNNLSMQVQITDAVDQNISEYMVSLFNNYFVPLNSETSKVNLLMPHKDAGSVPTDVLVTAQDFSGNASSATVQVMLQHDNRNK